MLSSRWYRRLLRPELSGRYYFLARGLGVLSLVKIWPFFPLYRNAVSLFLPALCLALGSALAMAAGRAVRPACAVLLLFFAAGFAGVWHQVPREQFGVHHIQLLLLALSALLLTRAPGRHLVFGVGLQWLRVCVFVMYGCSVWIKLTSDYLSGRQLQQLFYLYYWGSDPVVWPNFATAAQAAALVSVAVEVLLCVGFYFTCYRRALLLVAAIFHGTLFLLLPVSIYSGIVMVCLWALYAPAEVFNKQEVWDA